MLIPNITSKVIMRKLYKGLLLYTLAFIIIAALSFGVYVIIKSMIKKT